MEMFVIKYTESYNACFAVEAEDPDDALRRFDEWRQNADNVIDTMSNTDWIEAEAHFTREVSPNEIDDVDTLTDADYQAL